jgi:hypothetical protein
MACSPMSGTHEQSLSDSRRYIEELQALIDRFSTNQEYRQYNLVEELERLFRFWQRDD